MNQRTEKQIGADENGLPAPVPVMEYRREGELETRLGRARWLLGGMLMLSLAGALAEMTRVGTIVVLAWLPVAPEIAGLAGAGAGLAGFALVLVLSVLWYSNPSRTAGLVNGSGGALAGVVICGVVFLSLLAVIGSDVLIVRYVGVMAIGKIYQAQAYFGYARAVGLPAAVVLTLLALRRR